MRALSMILILIAPVAGVAAAVLLGPGAAVDETAATPADETSTATDGGDQKAGAAASDTEVLIAERSYVRVGRQIIIPVVEDRETTSLMLFELALDVPLSESERVGALEPRLRDAFLEVLFRMSNTGAFSGTYTDRRIIAALKEELGRTARRLLGDIVQDVLVLDVIRQEI